MVYWKEMSKGNNIPPWIRNTRQSRDNKANVNSNYDLYNSSKWRKVSKSQRINNPKCTMCGKPHHNYKGLVCDHIITINNGGSIWDERNHQSLCKKPCHALKSAKDKQGYKGPFKIAPDGKKIPI